MTSKGDAAWRRVRRGGITFEGPEGFGFEELAADGYVVADSDGAAGFPRWRLTGKGLAMLALEYEHSAALPSLSASFRGLDG